MSKPPHIVFIMADQLRYASCGFAGDGRATTPNIDRLAAEGVSFGNATSMHPVCGPYRASLFTGCHSSTTGYVINELDARTDLPTLAGALNAHGYECEYIGKWHMHATCAKTEYGSPGGFHRDPANQFVPPGPHRYGFDAHWAAYNFNHQYYRGFYYRDAFERIDIDGYEPDVQTDMAIERLRVASANDGPTFLCVSYGTPHQPWDCQNVPAEYLEQFNEGAFPLPENYADGHGRYWHGWFDEEWWAESVKPQLPFWQRCYYAMTANLDWNVGRIRRALDRLGMAEDTLLVFTSDHGEMFGAHGRAQKNIHYDEAARVPLLMRLPSQIPAGQMSDACINTPDLMPTLLSFAGAAVPAPVEGMDLSHCARGDAGPEPDAALLQGMAPSVDWDDGFEWRAVRDKRYTYARFRADGQEELFDNARDPLQMTNLADDAGHLGERERLGGILDRRMAELGDGFERATWYRDHWIEDGHVRRGARG